MQLSVVVVVNTQFSWSVCFSMYIYTLRGGGPCLHLWIIAKKRGVARGIAVVCSYWCRLSFVINGLRQIIWSSLVIDYHLTIYWLVKKVTITETWPDMQWRCIYPTLLYTRWCSRSVLICHANTRTKQDRTRNETGTDLSPWKNTNENNSLTGGVDFCCRCCHLSIVAGTTRCQQADNPRLDSPGASR